MGLIQSIFCTVTFCIERVLTWTCCAFVLMLLMFMIIVLMVYSISVGYHYAQKELAAFAMASRTTTAEGARMLRGGGGPDDQPVVRLVALNRSEIESAQQPLLEVYQTKQPGENIYMETLQTPIILLETEKPPAEPELSAHERELARKLIGRMRRSKNNSLTSTTPFLVPVKQLSPVLLTST